MCVCVPAFKRRREEETIGLDTCMRYLCGCEGVHVLVRVCVCFCECVCMCSCTHERMPVYAYMCVGACFKNWCV